jgi:regulator of ribonuclease activity A
VKFTTSDLCDAFPEHIRVADNAFRDYGGVSSFSGPIETLRVFEDNALVAGALETAGRGRVLVLDGGGSLRTALVGGRLAALAHANGWAGLIVNGCIRDSVEIRETPIGVRALSTSPLRSGKEGSGQQGGQVSFAGLTFSPGQYLYADEDGIVVADLSLTDQAAGQAKRPVD